MWQLYLERGLHHRDRAGSGFTTYDYTESSLICLHKLPKQHPKHNNADTSRLEINAVHLKYRGRGKKQKNKNTLTSPDCLQQTAENAEQRRDGIGLTFTADGAREVSPPEIIFLLCGVKRIYMCECEAPDSHVKAGLFQCAAHTSYTSNAMGGFQSEAEHQELALISTEFTD